MRMVVEDEHDLGLTDHHGRPTFVCRIDSTVARAAERADTLTTAGRLERTAVEDCECCAR